MKQINKKISAYNHYDYNTPQFIILHYVGANSTAKNNADYFYGGDRQASAHYFVDDNEIWQSVEDYNGAWHIGNSVTAPNNTNSVGIEMCLVNGQVTETTEQNALELARYLMDKYGISIENVRTHAEVTGYRKICPNWSDNNWLRWRNFKNKLIGIPVEKPSIKENPTAQTPQPSGGTGQYLFLKGHMTKWNIYPTNVAPVTGNQCGTLNPSLFGGIEYEILGNPLNDVYTIQTRDYGRVNIYVPRDGDSEFYSKGSTPPQQTSNSTPQPSGEYTINEYSETGTFTCTTDSIFFRNKPYVGGDNPTVDRYYNGETVNYDYVVITNKYTWISWISASSGIRRYMPITNRSTGEKWGYCI